MVPDTQPCAQHFHLEACDKWLHLALGCFSAGLCQQLGCSPAKCLSCVHLEMKMNNTSHCVRLSFFPSLHPNLIFLLGFRDGFNQGQRIAKTYMHCDKICCSLVLVTEASSSSTPGRYFPTLPPPVTDTSSGVTVVIPREQTLLHGAHGEALPRSHCPPQRICQVGGLTANMFRL